MIKLSKKCDFLRYLFKKSIVYFDVLYLEQYLKRKYINVNIVIMLCGKDLPYLKCLYDILLLVI